MNILRNALCLTLVSASFACSSGDAVDIGTSRTGQKLEDYAATWVGYVEAYNFIDGSDKVRITLDASGNGTLEVGDSPAVAPATDPNAGYALSAGPAPEHFLALLPGASYPIKTATVESARIQLAVNPFDVWGGWCALQTSYYDATNDAYHACGPDLSSTSGDVCTIGSSQQPIDCGKLNTCTLANCSCSASGCTAFDPGPSAGPYDFTQLDGALADTGQSLVGTLVLSEAEMRVNVRLTRQ